MRRNKQKVHDVQPWPQAGLLAWSVLSAPTWSLGLPLHLNKLLKTEPQVVNDMTLGVSSIHPEESISWQTDRTSWFGTRCSGGNWDYWERSQGQDPRHYFHCLFSFLSFLLTVFSKCMVLQEFKSTKTYKWEFIIVYLKFFALTQNATALCRKCNRSPFSTSYEHTGS